jgi:hypothetical protein
MKIREGAYYRARGGQVFGPMVPGGTPASDYVWCLDPLIQGYNWDSEGSWRKGWDGPLDLISEVYVRDTPPADVVNPFQNFTIGTYAPETKTLRDEFAGYAIIGLLAAGDCHAFNRDEMAVEAYKQADSMLEAREK